VGSPTRLSSSRTDAIEKCSIASVNDKPARQKSLSHYLVEIARLGDYLARASDPPPRNTVM
jgi:hypothetical protein